MKKNTSATDIPPCAEVEDCCITAAHTTEERFRRRNLTPEERKEVGRDLEKLRERLGLIAKADSI